MEKERGVDEKRGIDNRYREKEKGRDNDNDIKDYKANVSKCALVHREIEKKTKRQKDRDR